MAEPSQLSHLIESFVDSSRSPTQQVHALLSSAPNSSPFIVKIYYYLLLLLSFHAVFGCLENQFKKENLGIWTNSHNYVLIQYEPSAQASTIQIIIGKKVKKNIKLLSSGSLNIELLVFYIVVMAKTMMGVKLFGYLSFILTPYFIYCSLE